MSDKILVIKFDFRQTVYWKIGRVDLVLYYEDHFLNPLKKGYLKGFQ